ncbi:MAG: ferritin-like domain-containing protein [Myxococcota bacterium]|nr:ferritin-like domain-containing protein [Myxococcota bacterium]
MPVIPLIARLIHPLTWASPRRTVRRLSSFARAEDGSRIDLCAAAAHCDNPQRAAAYLEHARDEARHTRMFAAHARRLAEIHHLPPPAPIRADGGHLFETLGETRFLAFVHLGEQRAVQQFTGYARWLAHRDAKTAAVFTALVTDERRHAAYSLALLVELAGEQGARRALRRAAVWELWQAWQRVARHTARLLYRLLFLTLVPLLAVLSVWVRAVRPQQKGWQ